MRFKLSIILCLLLGMLTSCKKNVEQIIPEKIDPLENSRDSVSYVLDGKKYTDARFLSGYKGSNLLANIKVDSISNNRYYLSADKDSIMYSKTFGFDPNNSKLEITFLKKFSKNDMKKAGLYVPSDLKSFYGIGKRKYAIDFERDNKQDGVSILLRNNFVYKTFGSDSFNFPPTLNADVHNLSNFEVTKVTKLKSGDYILEAKFNTTIFDQDNNSKKIDNGYLRLRLNFESEPF